MTTDALREKVGRLPTGPGVYLLKDDSGRILYVGKATSLRSRVRSYLAGSGERPHLAPILARWRDVQILTTSTVAEALVLENSLIKKERPPGNVRLRDDKRYLCLRVDLTHMYPRITLVRRFRRDGALYFGPYADAKALRRTLRALREIYPLRTCSDHTLESIAAPCLFYQLGRCAAPCHDHIDETGYRQLVDDALGFLRGKGKDVLRGLRGRMEAESEALRFETAARIRDQIHSLERTLERQKVALPDDTDRDVIGIARQDNLAVVQVLFIRGGAVVSGRDIALPRAAGPDDELLLAFMAQFYDETKYVPAEILLPAVPEGADGEQDVEVLAGYLSDLRGSRVRLHMPQRGVKRELLEMAQKNARVALGSHRRDRAAAEIALEILAERLALPRRPEVIECFDISHLQGREVVASLVRFSDGRPDKAGYRRFRIREAPTNDDFASMGEVLRRRYRADEDGIVRDRPDLVVVDGGKGQLGAAVAAAAEVGFASAPIVALAKARPGRSGVQTFERVFIPDESLAVVLPPDGPETHLLARIRDEAHRFAISYHRKLRSKVAVESALDRIEGVGPRWRRELLQRFGSVKGIREATLEELTAVPGIGRKRALQIKEHLE